LAAGVHIHEQTTVERVTRDPQPRVITPRGTVTADKVVMASNAHTPEIGEPGDRVYPLLVTLFETEPLSDQQLAAIGGWTGREGIYTAHESMESYRLTAQRTIIGGSKDVQYFYDCRASEHGGEKDAARMSVINAFRQRFPDLAQVGIAHAWAGWIGMTMNFLPIIGQSPRQSALYYAVGYNGHGVAQACGMGGVLADRMLGRANPWHEIICRKPAYLPARPMRWLVARGLMGFLNGVDRRIDRRILREGVGR
jgi:gamma-glutamylputrescine oxidase